MCVIWPIIVENWQQWRSRQFTAGQFIFSGWLPPASVQLVSLLHPIYLFVITWDVLRYPLPSGTGNGKEIKGSIAILMETVPWNSRDGKKSFFPFCILFVPFESFLPCLFCLPCHIFTCTGSILILESMGPRFCTKADEHLFSGWQLSLFNSVKSGWTVNWLKQHLPSPAS